MRGIATEGGFVWGVPGPMLSEEHGVDVEEGCDAASLLEDEVPSHFVAHSLRGWSSEKFVDC